MDFPTQLQLWGAAGFGAIIGWYIYYINRYRKDDVQFSDLTTIIGIIGGGGILKLFQEGTPLFGAYGIGLFIGFFSYLLLLSILVKTSPNFGADYFLDGRRKKLADDEEIPVGVQQPVRPAALVERVQSLEHLLQARNIPLELRPTLLSTTLTWKPGTAAQRVIDACEDAWDDGTKADCSKYLNAVSAQFGVIDFAGDQANAISAHLEDSKWLAAKQWIKLDNGAQAKVKADAGYLVVGAIQGRDYVPAEVHGHVVVVVSSENLHRGKYPFAYWGRLGSVGEKNAPVTLAFNAASVDKVVYAAKLV